MIILETLVNESFLLLLNASGNYPAMILRNLGEAYDAGMVKAPDTEDVWLERFAKDPDKNIWIRLEIKKDIEDILNYDHLVAEVIDPKPLRTLAKDKDLILRAVSLKRLRTLTREEQIMCGICGRVTNGSRTGNCHYCGHSYFIEKSDLDDPRLNSYIDTACTNLQITRKELEARFKSEVPVT